ncbi:MAG: hypothetical protein WA608_25335 [Candidatus Acidiferrales bacterium]
MNVARLSMLAAGNCDDAIREVDILPAQMVLLAAAHTSVQREVELCFPFRIELSNLVPESQFFPLFQETHALIIFLAPLRFAHRIDQELAVANGEGIDEAQERTIAVQGCGL